jgi:hypothetical protein
MARPASARAAATVGRLTDTPNRRSAVSGSTATRPVPMTTIVPVSALLFRSGMRPLLEVSGDGSRGRRKRPPSGVWCVEATHHLA